MAKIIIKDGQIVSQDGSQLKFENTPISGTTAEFTSITAENLYGDGSNIDNVVKTTNVNQTIGGTKTFSNTITLYNGIFYVGGKGTSQPSSNSVVGFGAMMSTTTGENNVAIGRYALKNNVGGSKNIAIGNESLFVNLASNNVAIGNYASRDSTGQSNTAVGYYALRYAAGDNNVAIGNNAGNALQTGDNNAFIGPYAGYTETSLSDTTIIRNGAAAGKERLRIDSSGNISINSTSASGYRLFVNGTFRATYANLDGAYVGINGIEVDGDINANGDIYGDGSNLDNVNATLLNSQPGSYYLDYANFTGTPPSPNDSTITISAGDGLQTGGDFTTNQSADETITLNVDSTVVRTTNINQTIDGTKTFLNDIAVNSLTVGKGNSSLSNNTAIGVDVLTNASEATSTQPGDIIPGYEGYTTGFDGDKNVGVGFEALKSITHGQENVSIGYKSQTATGFGFGNTTIGSYSGFSLSYSHGGNTFVGYRSGHDLVTGYNNIFIGPLSGDGITNISDTTIISNGIGKERIRIDSNGFVSINSTSAYSYRMFVSQGTAPNGAALFSGKVVIAGDFLVTGLVDFSSGFNANNLTGVLSIDRIANGSITNAKLQNSSITINGTQASLGSSVTIETSGIDDIIAGDGLSSTVDSVNETKTLSVDSTVVRTTGIQSVSGVKTFFDTIEFENGLIVENGNLTVNDYIIANGSLITSINASNISSGTLSIARIADSSITNAKLQNSSITVNGTAVNLGGELTFGVTEDLEAASGIHIELNEQTGKTLVSVDSTVVRTTGNQTIAGVKTFQLSSTAGNTSYLTGTAAVLEGNSSTYLSFLSPSTSTTGIAFKDSSETATYKGAIFYKHGTDSLEFRTAGNSSARMYINNSGKIGIGTTNPGAPLHIKCSDHAYAGVRLEETDATTRWDLYYGSSNSSYGKTDNSFYIEYNGGNNGINIDTTGNLTVTGTITELSTRRVKKNIRSIGTQLNKIKKLNPVSYNRKEVKNSKKELGFISEEVKEVYPELVNGEGVNYSKMVSILVGAVKELTEKVEQQEKQIKDLKRMVR